MRTFSTRSNAVRAARAECRKVFPKYEAFEGPDYFIHPQSRPFEIRDRYSFELSPSFKAAAASDAGVTIG